jgi:hypothetical protein
LLSTSERKIGYRPGNVELRQVKRGGKLARRTKPSEESADRV